MKEVIVCEYARDFKTTFFNFLEQNKDNLFKYYNTYLIGVAELKDGREVWIMPYIEYKQWCKGRTYIKNGKILHSDYPVVSKDKMENEK